MYNEAIEVLKKHANDLKEEMKDVVKKGCDMPASALSAVIFGYQNRVNEVTDAILTLKSIEDDEAKDNDELIGPCYDNAKKDDKEVDIRSFIPEYKNKE